MAKASTIGSLEAALMKSIMRLGEGYAYGVPIRQEAQGLLNKEISLPAMYTALDRLKERGYIDYVEVPGTAENGNRTRRYYEVKGSGQSALDEVTGIWERIVGHSPRAFAEGAGG